MSQYDHPIPIEFRLEPEQRILFLYWSDGHESIHGWENVRWACPCAWCAGEGGLPGMLEKRDSLTVEETTLVNIQPIGRYGLTPVWEDGHKTGIYTYEKWRGMCECDECRKNKVARP